MARELSHSWPTCCWIIFSSLSWQAVDLCVCVVVVVCDVADEGIGGPFSTGRSLPTWDCLSVVSWRVSRASAIRRQSEAAEEVSSGTRSGLFSRF